MTGSSGGNTTKFVPSRWGSPPCGPTQMGLCKLGWVWSSLRSRTHSTTTRERSLQFRDTVSKLYLPKTPARKGYSVQTKRVLTSEVSKRGWREGVGDERAPKHSKNRSPELCSPSPKGGIAKRVQKRGPNLWERGIS